MIGLNRISLDGRVLAFTLLIAVITAFSFGMVPLLQFRRLDVNHSLKQSTRSLASTISSRRLRSVLICSEVAVAFVLLIGAALLIQTVVRLRNVEVGCRTSNILTLRMPSPGGVKPDQVVPWQNDILQRIRALPGVASAGFTNHIPLVDKGDVSGLLAEGRDPRHRISSNSRVIGPDYLRTMGIPVLRGRDINEQDGPGAPPVALINQTLAAMLWPGQDPIGRHLIFGTDLVPIIGVVGDVHQSGLAVPAKPEFYLSSLQSSYPPGSLAIHTRMDPKGLVPAVRRAIWSLHPDQPITDVATMDEVLDQEVFERRTQTTLVAVFAGLSLLLAAIGLYGVLAYTVGRQTPEIGLRIALGASPVDVLFQVVGSGLRLVGIGLAAGIAGALAASRLLTSLLFGVTTADPATYVAVAAVLLSTALLASYLPARRAMRISPIAALHDE